MPQFPGLAEVQPPRPSQQPRPEVHGEAGSENRAPFPSGQSGIMEIQGRKTVNFILGTFQLAEEVEFENLGNS